jgi:hypothetical protein
MTVAPTLLRKENLTKGTYFSTQFIFALLKLSQDMSLTQAFEVKVFITLIVIVTVRASV